MKKILHIFTVSMSVIFLEGLSAKLREHGYELIMICADGCEVREEERRGNLSYYPIEIQRGVSPFKNFMALMRIRNIMKVEKPAIIHGHTPMGGLLSMLAAKSLGIQNRAYHLHGLKYPSETGMRKVLIKTMEKVTLSLATRVYAVSFGLKDFAIQEHMAECDKLTVLMNGSIRGIDIMHSDGIRQKGSQFYKEKYQIPMDTFVFGYVGRINEDKGFLELISAIQRLEEEHYDAEFIICGNVETIDPKNDAIIEKFLKKSNVRYFGLVSNPLEYMVCCDTVVLPTHREGFGLVNIEANSVGVPAITTNVMGCISSIEDHETGIFVGVENVDELVEAMKYMVDHPDERKEMGENGIVRVNELFDRDKIWDALISEYDLMMGE